MGKPAPTCYNQDVTIIGEIPRDGLCACDTPPRDGSAWCSPDCEPELVSDPNDPWGFLERAAATELARMWQNEPTGPWPGRS